MPPASHRILQAAGLVLAVLLVGLAFYPGAVASPYVAEDSYRYNHQIVPETAAAYDETVEQARTYRYSELSGTAQTFVDRTRAAPAGEYTPVVCQEFVLTCDEYSQDDLPPEFTYGEDLQEEDASVVIRDGDEAFLFQTGMVGHGWFRLPLRFLTASLLLLPLAGVVSLAAIRSESERVLAGAAGAGAIIASLAVATPYIEMYGLLDAQTTGLLLLAGVWTGILAMGGYRLAQRR